MFLVITAICVLVVAAAIISVDKKDNNSVSSAPKNNYTDLWKAATDSESGITFKYPEKLETKYIRVFDWPPKVAVHNKSFSCLETGSEISLAGITEKHEINGKTYCVTKISEGAAGSIYTSYVYAAPRDNYGTIIFTFSTRMTQCGNYDETEMKECDAERAKFNMDMIADLMIQSAE